MSNGWPYRWVHLGEYDIPQDALQIAQDIRTLEEMIALCRKLEVRSFVRRSGEYQKEKESAVDLFYHLKFVLIDLKRYAEMNLRKDYLSKCNGETKKD